MKKVLIIVLLFSIKSSSQVAFPNLIPSTADSIRFLGNVNGAPRMIFGADIIKGNRAAILSNTSAIATKLNISDTANIRLRPVAGTGMTITGTYPNLTFNSTASGGGGTLQQVLTAGSTLTQANTITNNTYLRFAGAHTRADSLVVGTGAPKGNALATLRSTALGYNVFSIPTIQGDTATGTRAFGNFQHSVDQNYVNEDGQRDAGYSIGYNVGPMNANEATFQTSLESHYQPFSGAQPQFEWYLQSRSKNNNYNRHLAFNVNKLTGTTQMLSDADDISFRSTIVNGNTDYFSTTRLGITTFKGTAAALGVLNTTSANSGGFNVAPAADGRVLISNSGRNATDFANKAQYGFNFKDSIGDVLNVSRGALTYATGNAIILGKIRVWEDPSTSGWIEINSAGGQRKAILGNGATGKVNIDLYNSNHLYINGGNTIIGATSDDAINKLQVTGNVKATQFRLSALNTAPTSATDTGTTGEMRITTSGIYICTATNTWIKCVGATF